MSCNCNGNNNGCNCCSCTCNSNNNCNTTCWDGATVFGLSFFAILVLVISSALLDASSNPNAPESRSAAVDVQR